MRVDKWMLAVLASVCVAGMASGAGLVFEAKDGIGKDKHIVLIAGDEEYRSEESCPMLAKILNTRFGFKTTVLFSINPDGGYVDPNYQKSIPGMDAVKTADVVIIGTRFRKLSNEQFQPLADHLNAGKPIIGFRTATHAFQTPNTTGGIAWGKFGPNILGEGWVNHHGKHKVEGARGVVNEPNKDHVILRGVSDVFADSDVYGIRRVKEDNATILLWGQVTKTLLPDSEDVTNKPKQPLAWLRTYKTPQGTKEGTAFCTTMGASSDFRSEGLRRLVVNAAIHLAGLEVPEKANVDLIDPFVPSFYGFIRNKAHFKGLNYKPEDYDYGKSPLSGPVAKHYK